MTCNGGPSMDDLRNSRTELRIQRLRDELEASMRSTRRGRLVWWLAERVPWWRRVLDARLAGLARMLRPESLWRQLEQDRAERAYRRVQAEGKRALREADKQYWHAVGCDRCGVKWPARCEHPWPSEVSERGPA